MQTRTMIAEIAHRADLEDPEAIRPTVSATMRALGFVMPAEEARDAAAQLPDDVALSLLSAPGSHRDWTDEEFVTYVAEDTGVDGPTARSRIGAVLAVLREALTSGEYGDTLRSVDPSITDLLAG